MSGMFGANTPPPNVTNFQMPGMGDAAGGALGQTGNFFSGAFGQGTNQFLPEMQGLTQGLINQSGPLSQYGMSTAGNLAPAGVGLGAGSMGLSNQLTGAAGGMVPYAMNLAQMGLDPNSAIYNRALQQTTDTTGANLANSGVGGTPYGQSVLGNTVGQFNVDWQQQQLQRAIAGAQGGASVLGAAGGVGQGAQALGQAGENSAIQSALLPWSVNSQIGGQNLNWLSALGQGQNTYAAVPQMGIQDYLGYLGAGNQANQIQNQGQEAYANFLAQQQQQQYNNIASAASGAGSLFGNIFGGGGAFGKSGAFGPSGAFPASSWFS